jgi:hypothetical protein
LGKNKTPFDRGVNGSPGAILMKSKMPGQARLVICLIVFPFLSSFSFLPAFAEEERQKHHEKSGEHHSRPEKEDEEVDDEKEGNGEKHQERGSHSSARDNEDIKGKERNEKEKGDEATALIAAGIFGLANLSAIFGILCRYALRLLGRRESYKNAFLTLNRFRQKHLRRFHYFLNIAAIAVASLHWYLSESVSFAFQQFGMILAFFLCLSGIMIKYRLLPQLLHRGLFNLHTSLFISLAALILLAAGHAFIDD